MINWITDKLGTASYYDESIRSADAVVIDVRELADKEGNSDASLRDQIGRAVEAARADRKVLVCCDMGISRSNAVALGVLMGLGRSYEEAAAAMSNVVNVSEINLALLRQVRALFRNQGTRADKQVSRILITGAAGYVGSALSDALQGEYELLRPRRNELDLARDSAALDLYVNEHAVDLVLHLAHARARNNMSAMGESMAMMKHVLEVCRLNRVPLVYLSTLAVFSGYHTDAPVTAGPDLPLWPRGTYGETKLFCEELIGWYRRNYGIEATILRPAAVYGPKMPPSTFVAKFFDMAVRGVPIRTHRYRNGLPAFDFLHLSDLAEAVRLALRVRPEVPVNLGTGIATSTYDLAQKISELAGRGSAVELRDIDDETYKIVVDPAEGRQALGWEPRVRLDAGLAELLQEHLEPSN
jgi:nucleoside-diphosphate-sugar epimerase/rhodanese-related sulfurtransferase